MRLGRSGWLVLTLTVAAVYSLPALRLTLGDQMMVADDARLHVFWMQRFADPSLFPNDPIADYWHYLAPPGYVALYYSFSTVGVPPLLFNKIAPLGIVLLSAALAYALLLEMRVAPAAAFIAGAITSEVLWMNDDVPSATPRAFAYPLLLALLTALARRRSSPGIGADAMVVMIATLHALLYPPASLVALGIILIDAALGFRSGDRRRRSRTVTTAVVCVVAVVALLLPTVLPGPFGDLYGAAATRDMPEYGEKGRLDYWRSSALEFWLLSSSSGLVGEVKPAFVVCGALLPLLLLRPARFPLARRLRALDLLAWPLVSGVTLFSLAHLFFPGLYLPSRYIHYSLRVVLVLATAVVLALAVDRVFAGVPARASLLRGGAIAVALAILIAILAYPLLSANYPVVAYHRTHAAELHRFLRAQAADIVVASVSTLADDIPTFSAREILVSPHYAVPHHVGYYDLLRARALDLIAAQYTDDPARLVTVSDRWSIDYWLLDDGWDRVSYLDGAWLRQFQPAAGEARAFLERGGVPALATYSRCTVLEGSGYRLLDAVCVRSAAATPAIHS